MARRALILAVSLLVIAPAAHAAERDFAKRFRLTAHGDITIAGNAPSYHNNDHPLVQVGRTINGTRRYRTCGPKRRG